MKKTKTIVITEKMQKVASNILIDFIFCKNMDEVYEAIKRNYDFYKLCEDPFTHLPCTPKEYAENSIEYEKHCAIEKYGHCDWL